MKNISFFPTYGYKTKWIAAIVAILSISLYFANNYLHYLQQSEYFLWVFALSLLTMVFSQEKDESEIISKIRDKSIVFSFGFTISVVLAISLTNSIKPFISEINLTLPVIFALILQQIVYYVAIFTRFKETLLYENKLRENIINNRVFYIIYLVILLIIFIVITMI